MFQNFMWVFLILLVSNRIYLTCILTCSLEETYEALRTFQILRVGKISDIGPATCPVIIDKLTSPASSPKDLFDAIRVNSILECQIGSQTFKVPSCLCSL